MTRETVNAWIKKPDWPVKRRGPWKVSHAAAVKGWRDATRVRSGTIPVAADSDIAKELQKAQLQVARERGAKLKLEREIVEQQHVAREQVDGALGGLGMVFLKILREIEHTWASRFRDGINQAELERLIDGYCRRVAEMAEIQLKSVTELSAAAKRPRRGRPKTK